MASSNGSSNNEHFIRVLVGIGLVAGVVIVVYVLNLAWVWFNNLDAMLTAGLPATLGGLALTAAAILGGGVKDLKKELPGLKEEADRKLGEAKDALIGEKKKWPGGRGKVAHQFVQREKGIA